MDEYAATSAGSAPERRHVLRSAGLGAAVVAGTVVLSACGSSTPDTRGAGDGGGAGASAGSAGTIPVVDVPVGGGLVVAADKVVVTQPTEGAFKAFDVTCPHQGCAVSTVTRDGIVCPCHGSVFDVATGERRSGPAQRGLAPRSITVSGDRLTLS
jgi:Rieske Fe-S protein